MVETPDETTLCRFRNLLVEKGLYNSIFIELNRQLEQQGIKVKKADAALLDATIFYPQLGPEHQLKTMEK